MFSGMLPRLLRLLKVPGPPLGIKKRSSDQSPDALGGFNGYPCFWASRMSLSVGTPGAKRWRRFSSYKTENQIVPAKCWILRPQELHCVAIQPSRVYRGGHCCASARGLGIISVDRMVKWL